MATLTELDPGSSILFLGSGFSLSSTNIMGENPPSGKGLATHFKNALGLSSDADYSLQVLADEFHAGGRSSLYEEIYNLFHISNLTADQEVILKENWLRIYTTNYDDTVEYYQKSKSDRINSFNISDPIPTKMSPGAVIHLHGYVGRLRAENVLDQILLGEVGYARQYTVRSPWYTQFQSDLRYSSGMFIVGYSLSDYHISALLMEVPELRAKTFFIQGNNEDPIFERRTAAFGSVIHCGVDGFAKLVKALPRTKPLDDPHQLRCFRYLDPQRDKKGARPVTATEIFHLLAYGTFNYARYSQNITTEHYVFRRSEALAMALEKLIRKRTIVVDGRLGNGKTIFLFQLFLEMSQIGYKTYLFRANYENLEREIKYLKAVGKCLILFDEYTLAQDVIGTIAQSLPEAKFVVEVRTSIFEVRFHEMTRQIPAPYERITLNKMSDGERISFHRLCENAGIPVSKALYTQKNLELRELILTILDSLAVKAKIDEYIGPIFSSTNKRKILLLTMLLAKYHLSLDAGFIRAVVGVDPYKEFREVEEVASELFEVDAEDFKVRSALFCAYATRRFLSNDEIVDCLVDTAVAAARRRNQRAYRVLMGSLMQFSNLREIFESNSSATDSILDFYERLRYDDSIKDEPLFWLQYAIAIDEAGRADQAWQFIRMAYDKANALDGFRTFQIDTQALRILLKLETEEGPGQPIVHLAQIFELIELVNRMIGDSSHRVFAIKVLRGILPFVVVRKGDLYSQEKSALVYWLNVLSRSLEDLPLDFKIAAGSEIVRSDIDEATRLILQ